MQFALRNRTLLILVDATCRRKRVAPFVFCNLTGFAQGIQPGAFFDEFQNWIESVAGKTRFVARVALGQVVLKPLADLFQGIYQARSRAAKRGVSVKDHKFPVGHRRQL